MFGAVGTTSKVEVLVVVVPIRVPPQESVYIDQVEAILRSPVIVMVEVSPSQVTGVAVMVDIVGGIHTGTCLNHANLGTLKLPRMASLRPSPSTSPKSIVEKLPICPLVNSPLNGC